MRYIVAMDSFKGSLTSEEAGKAVADNLKATMKKQKLKYFRSQMVAKVCLMHSAKPHMPHDFLYLPAML